MRACPKLTYLVTLQGLTGVIARYHYAGMTKIDILKHITLRDILRRDTILHGRKKRQKNGEFEKIYIQTAQYVSGRTSWDFSHVKALNQNSNYLFCNESLRNGFSLQKNGILIVLNHILCSSVNPNVLLKAYI